MSFAAVVSSGIKDWILHNMCTANLKGDTSAFATKTFYAVFVAFVHNKQRYFIELNKAIEKYQTRLEWILEHFCKEKIFQLIPV